MKIQIVNRFSPTGQEYIEWDLHDGPDGIEHARGYAIDLIQAFSKILEWRERIANDYRTINDYDQTGDVGTTENQGGSESVGEGTPI
jgi:hypothetical protein